MRLRFIERIAEVSATDWDRLFQPSSPFVRHRFLDAMERGGCVGAARGWLPHHALLEDASGQLLAAAPLYFKQHSYGEFVFDFSWAQASHGIGVPYYPKWLIAAPFTPSTGPRFGAVDAAARHELLQRLVQAYERAGHSSLHALFLNDVDAAAAEATGAIARHDVQFHWRNDGYADFSDFVARLTSDKRKKILRERRRVAEAGIRFEWLPGEALDEDQWRQVYALYGNTYEERGQAPYLSLQFFLDYGCAPGSPIRLILGYEGKRMVAVAITIEGAGQPGADATGATLYGRHWGAAEHYHSLHFETCYYQGIDYCIQHGIARYDAGAQGQHKLARGFAPVVTRSAHWLAEPRLRSAVRRALDRERAQVADWCETLSDHVPFKATQENPEAHTGSLPLDEMQQ